jgi:hypothetical protein
MGKMFSKTGDPLYRTVRIKVFAPGNAQVEKRIVTAPGGQGYSEDGVQQLLDDTANRIEHAMPGHEYRLVALGPATFNFVWVRYNAPQEEQLPQEAISTDVGAPDGDTKGFDSVDLCTSPAASEPVTAQL